MQFLQIAGYKFVPLNNEETETLRAQWSSQCRALALKGTVLISQEGINLSLAGRPHAICAFKAQLNGDPRFKNLPFHESYTQALPFRRLKIKLKNEIISLRQPGTTPTDTTRAPTISPAEFKIWLDEQRDIIVLDTRNVYEVQVGTFTNAVHLHINDFGEFPEKVKQIEHHKPIVMFCTGGVRCEKAAMYMLGHGFSNVFQLDGGILGYFKQIGNAHFQGECFVFDERVSVDHHTHPN